MTLPSSESNAGSARKALFVGGCRHNFHFLEPALPHLQSVADAIDITLDTTGILHPQRFASGTASDLPEIAGSYGALTAESLSAYDLLFLFTTGEGNGEEVPAIVEWVRNGGALVGIHCAADSFVSNADYIAALGGRFRTHPAPLDITITFVDETHPITADLSPFTVRDELYLFRDYDAARVHLLGQTSSYTEDQEQKDDPIPICWTRTEGNGRIFYLSLGHFPEVMANETWQTLVRRGALWAMKVGL